MTDRADRPTTARLPPTASRTPPTRRDDARPGAAPPRRPAATCAPPWGVGLLLGGLVIGTLVVDAQGLPGRRGRRGLLRRVGAAPGDRHPRDGGAARAALLGSAGMLVSAYLRGAEALVVTFGLTVVGLLVWRVADGLAGAARDLSASALVAFYPIFLGGFASMMLASPGDGGSGSSSSSSSRCSRTSAGTPSASCSAGTRWHRRSAPRSRGRGSRARWSRAPSGARSRCRWCSAAVVGRRHPRRRRGGRRDPGRPHRVEHQARPRHQGHGRRCCPGTAA